MLCAMDASTDQSVSREKFLTWIFTIGEPNRDVIAACGRQLEMGNFAWVIVPMSLRETKSLASEMYGWDSMS